MTTDNSPPDQGPPRAQLASWLPAFGEALRFLTIIPQPWLPPTDEHGMLRALPWFPAVGLVIGGLLVPVGWLASQLWGPLVAATMLVVVWAVLTGGLHLDGLSDTFDGVMSWRPRARKLEIMKDSRIGAMGVLALIAVLLLKVALLAAASSAWWQVLLLSPLLGRWAALFGIAWFPPAAEGGLGRTFHSHLRSLVFLGVTALTSAAALLIAGASGLVALLLVALCTYLLGRWWTRDLGGLTGDTYGAICEIAEVVALATIIVAS